MSTRATYRFVGSFNDIDTTIYVHHDGYATGAASYFYDTLIGNQPGRMAERFLRSVPRAEITKSHEWHGDTEFRYDVIGDGPGARLVATERLRYGDEKSWRVFFSGTLAEFMDEHRPQWGLVEEYGYHPFEELEMPYERKVWHNRVTAIAKFEEPDNGGMMRSSFFNTLVSWYEQSVDGTRPINPDCHGNWRALASQVRTLAEHFALTKYTDKLDKMEREMRAALAS